MKFIKMYQNRFELWAYPRVAQGFCWVLMDPSVGVVTTGWSSELSEIDEFVDAPILGYLSMDWFDTSEASILTRIFPNKNVGLIETMVFEDGESVYAEYLRADGTSLFEEWYEDLDEAKQAIEAAHASFLGTPT